MNYYFAEIKDNKIYAFHDATSLDLIFSRSDGLLMELSEQEYNILKACKGNIDKGISMLMKIAERMEIKTLENL